MNNIEVMRCTCGTEMIRAEYDDGELILAVYSYAFSDRITIKERLRHILYIIKHGTPFCDMIILNREDTIRLKKMINRISK